MKKTIDQIAQEIAEKRFPMGEAYHKKKRAMNANARAIYKEAILIGYALRANETTT